MNGFVRYLYHAVWAFAVAILLAGLVIGITTGEPGSTYILLTAFLVSIFFVTPLAGIFLLLNAYGFFFLKTHRLRYGLLTVVSAIWVYLGVNGMLDTVLP